MRRSSQTKNERERSHPESQLEAASPEGPGNSKWSGGGETKDAVLRETRCGGSWRICPNGESAESSRGPRRGAQGRLGEP